MKIIGARLKGQTDTITLPRMASAKSENFTRSKIIALINRNLEDEFIFIIQDNKGGKWVRPFGPDSLNTTIPIDGQEQQLMGMEIPIIHDSHLAKFNSDGTIEVIEVNNEGALPRESTVKQLEKIRKATKSTTIDDRVPKLKGSNLSHERNYVDSGIESYEDFERKNKSFTPSWNLKHLKSPFKASVKNEGVFDFMKKKSDGIHSTHYWSDYEKENLMKAGFKFVDTRKTNSTPFGYFQFDGYFLIKLAIGRSGYEDHKYQLIKNDRIQKEFTNTSDIIKWKNKNLGPKDIKFQSE